MSVDLSSNTIREWQQGDLSAIRKIGWRTWQATYGDFVPQEDMTIFHENYYSLEKLTTLFRNPDMYGFIAEAEGKPVGYSKCHDNRQEGRFYITSLYVLPEFQGQRLGKMLLEQGIARAKSIGHTRVWLGVMLANKSSLKWYLKNEFVFVEQLPFVMGFSEISHLIGFKEI
ncbi:MAG: GNAT family N-acetyltransferase [Lentisphaeria bacterium]|nr:GNAT family N-acetyltransferase [Candidatus Neomarinimicrobiota bacterium]MCF7841860.1 GNAT family N-acetyltransferase [Lentisphaeria bacterium]